MNKEIKEFRKYLGCCGCWGRDYNIMGEFVCLFDMFDENRPDCVSPYKRRYQLSGKTDRDVLMEWACEYRLNVHDINRIRSGQYYPEDLSIIQIIKIEKVIQSVLPDDPYSE
ncbi:hypothetical protein [Methanospirillum sp.]